MKPIVNVDKSPAPSFVLDDELPPFVSEWHRHRHHQVLYSRSGALRLQVGGAQWLVPPQRAAWLSAGVSHKVWSSAPISLRTAYLHKRLGGDARGCRVFELPAVGRAMLEYGARWGPETPPRDRRAAAYFAVLADLCLEWAQAPDRFSLPAARTAPIEKVMARTMAGIEEQIAGELDEPPSLADLAREVGMSARTLQRQFTAETGTPWRTFAAQARMLRAVELLAAPGARVTDVAARLGFASFGAFTRAFSRLTGDTPRDYAARARAR